MKRKPPNMLGAYGSWAAEYQTGPPLRLSYLNPKWKRLVEWKHEARESFVELIGLPKFEPSPELKVCVRKSYVYQDLQIQELSWRLPYGPDTEAIFLKPVDNNKRLPGILGLHDHGAVKYFGKRKITRTSDSTHPFILEHQHRAYGGVAWANELARRGYGVLVHDVFAFGSRRINPSELPGHVVHRLMRPIEEVEELKPKDLKNKEVVWDYDVPPDETLQKVKLYHAFARQHEDIVAKSLFCAGLTWPGLFVFEDRWALDYLCSRPDIDARRIGCCGLSGGGLRTNYLAGLDDRIRCSVTVGFMTTWRDFLLNSCYTHTWMVYIPHLPSLMDYPEILAMRVPLPSMIMATDDDPLFAMTEVKRAADILDKMYKKAGAPTNLCFSVSPGPHQFSLAMQKEAFDWLDRWLK